MSRRPRHFRDMTEPQIGAVMRRAGSAAQRELPGGSLFVLLSFDDPEVAQYLSNATRGDVIRALREAADRLERRETVERVRFTGV